jgi:hypothetical protein
MTQTSRKASLLKSKEEARRLLNAQMDKALTLAPDEFQSLHRVRLFGEREKRWRDFNFDLLSRIFTTLEYAEEYRVSTTPVDVTVEIHNDLDLDDVVDLDEIVERLVRSIREQLASLKSILDRLEIIDGTEKVPPTLTAETTSQPANPGAAKIFIGHGHSWVWRDLKDFIVERLGLPYDEFNAQSVAGLPNVKRLSQMLNDAAFAFLVMTAEDERADGGMQARMNVIHEVGLFQGRLGFEKAIVLLEEGCEEFSNIAGLGQIRFPPGEISAKFEEVRRVLEREAVIPQDAARFHVSGRRTIESGPLNIIVGSGGHFESKQAKGPYMVTHTFAVAVKNSDSKRFLSNCKFYLDITSPVNGDQRTCLLADTFTLNASEERYVRIVSYDEAATISKHCGGHIELLVPADRTMFAESFKGWPRLMPLEGQTFTLRATSTEGGVREVVCKVWVDGERILHFEKA